MKHIVTSIIAIALVITALLLPLNSGNAISYGAGDGTDAEIKTLEEAKEVLESAVYLSQNVMRNRSRAFSSNKLNYDSITLFFERDSHIGLSYGSNGRDMSIKASNAYYIDGEQIYIVCDAIITASAKYSSSLYDESQSDSSYIRMKAELYFSEDKILMKLNDFDAIASNSFIVAPAAKNVLLNKWIDMSSGGSSVESMLGNAMDMNADFLELLQDYVSNYDSEESFKNSNSVYTMKNDTLKAFFEDVCDLALGSMPFEVEADGKFEVDLSDKASPRIVLEVDYDFPESFTTTEYKGSYDSYYGGTYEKVTYDIGGGDNYESMIYEFANIDNTVIEFDLDSDDIYTMQEIEELMEEVG